MTLKNLSSRGFIRKLLNYIRRYERRPTLLRVDSPLNPVGLADGTVMKGGCSFLECLTFKTYFFGVKATLTSKGQITIPIEIRKRMHLKPGDVLEFDEKAPCLKATKSIPPQAWDKFGSGWVDPFPALDVPSQADELRSPVALPPKP